MAKLVVDEQAWETFTGLLGSLEFENGVSVLDEKDIPDHKIRSLSAIVKLKREGDDKQLGVTTEMLSYGSASADDAIAQQTKVIEPVDIEELAEIPADIKFYTAQELEEIADKEGINGLRKAAEGLHVKGRSIPELMDAILKAQGGR